MRQPTAEIPIQELWDRYALNPLTGTLISLRRPRINVPVKGRTTKRGNYIRHSLALTWNNREHTVSYGRVVHAWVTGAWALEDVDHREHDTTNNRPWNLQALTKRQNLERRRVIRNQYSI